MDVANLKQRIKQIKQTSEQFNDTEVKKQLSLLTDEYSKKSRMRLAVAKIEIDIQWRKIQ